MSEARKKIAVLVSADLLPGHAERREDAFEFEEQMGKITPAFAANGMDVDVINWKDAPNVAAQYDAMLPLLVWDYFVGNENAFMAAMAQVSGQTLLLNSFKTLQWNASKDYLEELGKQGAPTIQTVSMDKVSETWIARAMDTLRADKVVIKPDVGGGAWRQVVYEKGQPFPATADLPPRGALVQPFLERVQTEGEFSFLYFGDAFSHAVRKRPADGDYRIQSLYGGTEEVYTPTNEQRAQARRILDTLDFTPLYARVDLLPGNDGRLLLIELELIEPYLYLNFAEGKGAENKGAQKLAKALVKRLAG